MSRRKRHRPEFDEHLSGVRATFDADCPKCGDNINVGQQVVRDNKGRWVHVTCTAGWDE
jgi:hypothetical protein